MAQKPVYAMAICPHPDDGEFGIAGTAARWVKEGKDVVYVICTNGDKGTSDPEMKAERLAKIRQKEQRAAAKVLGVKKVEFLGYPDQGLEDTLEFRRDLVRMIRKYRPEVVATNNPFNRYINHRDHRMTAMVTLDAVFPYARDFHAFPELIEQGLLPHKVKEVLLWGSPTDNNYRIDITSTFDLKVEALRCHVSQFGDRFPRVIEMLTKRHKDMAKGEKFEMAEEFHREELMQ
jgi:LmbE family N-acetylglucosaminyl deacetylase